MLVDFFVGRDVSPPMARTGETQKADKGPLLMARTLICIIQQGLCNIIFYASLWMRNVSLW